jgi:hypothetical protein
VVCPSGGTRRARRACPALGQQICPVCCGTKRLIEIRCPDDCPYLATARDHPSAVVVRQRERDLGLVVHLMQDFSQRQSTLFLLVWTFLVRYRPPDFLPCVDDDVTQAVEALAATFETASRGLIYEHRPASSAAARLSSELKPLLVEAGGRNPGSVFERDAAVVLRRVQGATREVAALEPGNRRAFLDLLTRVSRERDASPGSPGGIDSPAAHPGEPDPPRLIVL